MIVQNFRAKPDTAMRHTDDLDLDEYRAAIAVTRLVLGPKARVQAPPEPGRPRRECRALLDAGVDDWGGVSPLTPDHVNPERPWPSLERLRAITAECGFELKARLTVHPEYVRAGEPWLDPRVSAHVAALATDDGLAKPGVRPAGLPWQEPDGGFASASAAPTCSPPSTPKGAHRRPPLRLRRRLRRLGLGPGGRGHDRRSRAVLHARNGREALSAAAAGRTPATSPTSTR